jgi:arylsulfatase A-like enzyme
LGRPNFLIFMPDQLRADCVGCFGNPVVRTPHIDALAARGVRFTNAYANHPVCGPSRVNLMTGWYPHTHGHRTLDNLVKPWQPNLLRYLKDAGYNVAFAGQRGDVFAPGVTEASTNFCGWSTKPTRLSMGPQFPEGSPLYDAFYHGQRPGAENWLDFDEAATRTALAWLADRPREPWLLFVPLLFPHLPFEAEGNWLDPYRDQALPAPHAPMAGKPAFHEAIRARYGTDRLTAEDWALIIGAYYAMISRVDEQLGRILAAIERRGATASTSVWFFTDHGEYLGDFGLVEKWPSGLDACLLHNPLIVTAPGACEGGTAPTFAEMVDVLPTILELAEVEVGHSHFGRSLVPALRDPTASIRAEAFSEGGFRREDVALFEQAGGEYAKKAALQHERPEAVGKAVAVRTASHTFVHRLYEDDELYDRRTDPGETDNLLAAATPGAEHAQLAEALRLRTTDWLLETSDVIPWTPDPRFPKVPNGYHDPVHD